MRIYKTKLFNRWADKEGLTDQALKDAVDEMESGLIDADLGGHVYKNERRLKDKAKVLVCEPSWRLKWITRRSLCLASRRISVLT